MAAGLTHAVLGFASGLGTPLGYLITPLLLWAGVGLASLPVIIHLLSRRRVRKVEWAAMNWLMAAMKRHQRRLRMENWLLLLLRVAAIVILGLALARPVLQDSALAGLVANKRSVYLVLDTSYSVEAKQQARSVLERVKHEADLVLRSIGPDDAAAVVVTNDPEVDVSDGLAPHVLLGRSVGTEGATRVREAVAALHARDAAADWARTLDMVQEQMGDQDVNRSVIIVTDLQAKDWLQAPRERLADGELVAGDPALSGARLQKRLVSLLRRPAKVRIIDVGGTDRRDLAVLKVENRTGQEPFVGRPLQLAVDVANFGAQPVTGAMLEIRVDDGAQRRSIPVPPLAAADTGLRVPLPAVETVQVDLGRNTFDRPGAHAVQITVIPPREDPNADALGLSSTRWLALDVRDRIRVLAWSQTSQSEQDMDAEMYLRAIYEGLAPGDSGAAMDGGLPPIYSYAAANTPSEFLARLTGSERVDLVVLANIAPRDPAVLKALETYVASGGGLLVFTGDKVGPDDLNSAFFNASIQTNGAARGLLPFAVDRVEVRERGDGSDPTKGAFALDLEFQEDPHPLAAPFTNVRAEDWIKRYPPAIWGRTAFVEPEVGEGPTTTLPPGEPGAAPSAPPPGRVVLRFRDKRPAVVAGTFGEGRTVWVGTSIDNGWLARAGALFLPVFLEESALYLTRANASTRNVEVGGTLRARLPESATKVRVVPPGGGALSPTRTTPEGGDEVWARYEYAGASRSGLWQVTYQVPSTTGETRDDQLLYAVNPDAREGSLLAARERDVRDGIPPELDLAFLPSYGEVSVELEEAREGEITRYLLWALIALLLLESFLALKFGRRSVRSEEGPTA
jgi:hypothetical protein